MVYCGSWVRDGSTGSYLKPNRPADFCLVNLDGQFGVLALLEFTERGSPVFDVADLFFFFRFYYRARNDPYRVHFLPQFVPHTMTVGNSTWGWAEGIVPP